MDTYRSEESDADACPLYGESAVEDGTQIADGDTSAQTDAADASAVDGEAAVARSEWNTLPLYGEPVVARDDETEDSSPISEIGEDSSSVESTDNETVAPEVEVTEGRESIDPSASIEPTETLDDDWFQAATYEEPPIEDPAPTPDDQGAPELAAGYHTSAEDAVWHDDDDGWDLPNEASSKTEPVEQAGSWDDIGSSDEAGANGEPHETSTLGAEIAQYLDEARSAKSQAVEALEQAQAARMQALETLEQATAAKEAADERLEQINHDATNLAEEEKERLSTDARRFLEEAQLTRDGAEAERRQAEEAKEKAEQALTEAGMTAEQARSRAREIEREASQDAAERLSAAQAQSERLLTGAHEIQETATADRASAAEALEEAQAEWERVQQTRNQTELDAVREGEARRSELQAEGQRLLANAKAA